MIAGVSPGDDLAVKIKQWRLRQSLESRRVAFSSHGRLVLRPLVSITSSSGICRQVAKTLACTRRDGK